MTRFVVPRRSMLFLADICSHTCYHCMQALVFHIVVDYKNSNDGFEFTVACPDTSILTAQPEQQQELNGQRELESGKPSQDSG